MSLVGLKGMLVRLWRKLYCFARFERLIENIEVEIMMNSS